MLFGAHNLPFLLGVAAVVIGLTAMAAVGLDEIMPRRPRLTIVMSALLLPLTLAIAGAILRRPDPRSIDGPAMVMILLLVLAFMALPACLATSAGVVWLRRGIGARARRA